MNFELWVTILVAIFPAVGVYAGVKADLALSRHIADKASQSADLAHKRIDDFLKG